MGTMVVSVGVETCTGIQGDWMEWVFGRRIIDTHDRRIQTSRAQRNAHTVAIKRAQPPQNANTPVT